MIIPSLSYLNVCISCGYNLILNRMYKFTSAFSNIIILATFPPSNVLDSLHPSVRKTCRAVSTSARTRYTVILNIHMIPELRAKVQREGGTGAARRQTRGSRTSRQPQPGGKRHTGGSFSDNSFNTDPMYVLIPQPYINLSKHMGVTGFHLSLFTKQSGFCFGLSSICGRLCQRFTPGFPSLLETQNFQLKLKYTSVNNCQIFSGCSVLILTGKETLPQKIKMLL